MSTFNDLKLAIVDVIREVKATDDAVCLFDTTLINACKTLQSEYNIYFVEPEDEQLNIV